MLVENQRAGEHVAQPCTFTTYYVYIHTYIHMLNTHTHKHTHTRREFEMLMLLADLCLICHINNVFNIILHVVSKPNKKIMIPTNKPGYSLDCRAVLSLCPWGTMVNKLNLCDRTLHLSSIHFSVSLYSNCILLYIRSSCYCLLDRSFQAL